MEPIHAADSYQVVRSRTLELVKRMQENIVADPKSREQAVFLRMQQLLKLAMTSAWWKERLNPYAKDFQSAQSLTQLLGSLPILERETLQEYGPWLQTWVPNSKPSDYSETSSSGSTGKPVTVTKFIPTQETEYLAAELFDLLWHKVDLNANFLVYRARKAPQINPSPMGAPLSFVGAKGMIFFRETSQSSLDEILDTLEENQISSLILTPLSLRMLLARKAERGKSDLNLKNVLTFADRVDQGLRELTRELLGANIIDRYSASEVGAIAIQCPHHDHLHALQILNFVEILNNNNLPCGEGEIGRVVVSALGSYGMPLIRYELGDTASWGSACEAGITLPVLRPEIVRVRESFINPNGAIQHILLDSGSFARRPEVRDYLLLVFQDRQALFLSGNFDPTESELEALRLELKSLTQLDLDPEVYVLRGARWLQKDKRRVVIFVDELFPSFESLDEFSKYLGN